jgi:arsenate reductase (glutaredoxin)
MSAITIYGLKNCDSCRKALRALPGATLTDVRAEGLPNSLLDRALSTYGAALVNTRSTTWRTLDETARQAPPADLLRSHPTLMKRPLIVAQDQIFLGWNNEVEEKVQKLV